VNVNNPAKMTKIEQKMNSSVTFNHTKLGILMIVMFTAVHRTSLAKRP